MATSWSAASKNTTSWAADSKSGELDFLFSDNSDFLFSDGTDFIFRVYELPTWTLATKN